VYKRPEYFDDDALEGDAKKEAGSSSKMLRKEVKNRAAIRTRRDSDVDNSDDEDDKLARMAEKRFDPFTSSLST